MKTLVNFLTKSLLTSLFCLSISISFAQIPLPNNQDVIIGGLSIEKYKNLTAPKDLVVKVPQYNQQTGKSSVVSTNYANMASDYKSSLTNAMDYLNEWKKTDNEGFVRLAADLSAQLDKDPNLSKNFRVTTKDGVTGISIGEPNIFIPIQLDFAEVGDCVEPEKVQCITCAAIAAFTVGYMIGTACYKSGLCNFVK